MNECERTGIVWDVGIRSCALARLMKLLEESDGFPQAEQDESPPKQFDTTRSKENRENRQTTNLNE